MANKSSPASKEEAANRSNQSETAEPMTASAYRMERGGPPPGNPEKRGNAAETVLWLLVILGLLILVMQGTGYVKLFALQSMWQLLCCQSSRLHLYWLRHTAIFKV